MKIIRHYLAIIFGTPLIWCYLKLIQYSSSIKTHGEHAVDQLRDDNIGHIFVFWHNRQFLLPLLRPDDTIYCLISKSRDGDLMAALVKLFGNSSVRGSSSRDGLAAMKQMMRLLKDGQAVGIATDGPRGPAFQVKPGAVQIAQAMQIPIIPVSFDASNKRVLGSWDSSYLLYPFGKIAIVYGDAINIDKGQSIEKSCKQVTNGLLAAGVLATNILENSK